MSQIQYKQTMANNNINNPPPQTGGGVVDDSTIEDLVDELT